MIWDFDSTLVDVHSEKEDAAPTYKRGFGFNPLAAWCDNTKEPLGATLRPGNAAPHNVEDHLELLEQVVRSVPAEYALGHEEGDDPALVLHRILVHADSAGASHRFVQSLSDANFDYSIGFPISTSVRDALLLAQEEDWVRATELGGGIRDGAEVIELTEIIELKGWPPDMRVFCRRERPHPGAQLSLFDTHAGWRHTCFITNTKVKTSRRWSCATGAMPESKTGCAPGRRADWPTCLSTASAPTRPGSRSRSSPGHCWPGAR